MIDAVPLTLDQLVGYAVPFLGGLLLGLFFYGGLWWTVRRLPESEQPALLTLGSFVVRTTATVLGLYLLMDGQIARVLVAMAAFLLVRAFLIRRLGPTSREDRNPALDAASLENGKERVHADQS